MIDISKVKVTHTMADGTQRDSVKGVEIPQDNPFYSIINAINRKILAGEIDFIKGVEHDER